MEKSGIFTPVMALVLFVAMFVVVMTVIAPVVRGWAAAHFDLNGTRPQVAFRIGMGLAFQWLMLVALLLILKFRGQTLADMGWGKPSLIWGWLLALGLVAFFAWSAFAGSGSRSAIYALNARTWLSDWSLFRTSLALGVAVTAGICEEVMFRGFVMTQARDAGRKAPLVVQILLSGPFRPCTSEHREYRRQVRLGWWDLRAVLSNHNIWGLVRYRLCAGRTQPHAGDGRPWHLRLYLRAGDDFGHCRARGAPATALKPGAGLALG